MFESSTMKKYNISIQPSNYQRPIKIIPFTLPCFGLSDNEVTAKSTSDLRKRRIAHVPKMRYPSLASKEAIPKQKLKPEPSKSYKKIFTQDIVKEQRIEVSHTKTGAVKQLKKMFTKISFDPNVIKCNTVSGIKRKSKNSISDLENLYTKNKNKLHFGNNAKKPKVESIKAITKKEPTKRALTKKY